MRIDRITLFPFEIPLRRPFRIATMVNSAAQGVFVRVESGGMTGWGECLPFHAINGETQATCIAALTFLAPIASVPTASRRETVNACRYALPTQSTALSGLDMALWDITAQQRGVPLWQLLGGSERSLSTDATIGIISPEEAVLRAAELTDDGFGTIKIKLGDGPAEDIKRVQAVRKSQPDIAIRVDANQAYTRVEALKMLSGIAKFEIEFCEQPVARADIEGLRWLHERSPVPVMADESCFSPGDTFELFARGACSLVNVKLSKSSGIESALEIAAIARAAHGRCMIGGMAETRLGVTAAACVGASDTAFKWFDLDAHLGHAFDPIEGGIQIHQGLLSLPEEPGLGARPSEEFLKTLTRIDLGKP